MPDSVKPNPVGSAAQDPPASATSGDDRTAPAPPRAEPTAPRFDPPATAGEVGMLGPYRVVKELGRGGMGAVYLAIDTRLERKLALKVMLPEFTTDRDAKERFLREARAAAKISHDNVVTVHEADERNGVPYITMQFLQGYPLDLFLRTKGTPALLHVVRIARETALGLAAAHGLGLVHRDIKPANLWLEAPAGRVKVLDFGLAKPLDGMTELTRTGVVVGTPAYMSPEQARGLEVDHRTDLFSLGAVLYRLCTGRNPFDGPNVMAVLMALGAEEPAPVRQLNPNIPDALARLVHQLLTKKPKDRPQTAAEVARRLRAVLDQLAAPTPVGQANTSDASTSQPVVIHPLPVQPPAVSRLRVTAAPEHETATADEPDEADAPAPVRVKAKGKGVRIAAGLAVVLATVVAATVIGIKNKGGSGPGVAVPGNAAVVEKNGWEVAKIEPATVGGSAPLSLYDKLNRKDIPARELTIAGEGNPANAPTGLVAIGGESGFHHWRNVVYVGFRDAGTTLVTASKDGTLRYWEHAAGVLKRSVQLPIWTHVLSSDTFDLSSDGSLAALIENDKLVVRRTDTLDPVYTRLGMWGRVRFSPDGNWLVAAPGEWAKPALLFDTRTFRVIELAPEFGGGVPAFSPDSKTIAIFGRNGKQLEFRFYEVPTGKMVHTLPVSSSWINDVCWHPSGKFLIVASGDKTRVLDAKTGAIEAELDTTGGAHRVTTDPGGKYLITGEYDSFRIRDWGKWSNTGRRTVTLGYESGSLGLSSADILAVGDGFFGVHLVSPSGAIDLPKNGHSPRHPELLWPTPDGKRVIRATEQVEWLAVDRPGLPVVERLPDSNATYRGGGAISADGRWLTTVAGEGMTVWDLTTRLPNKPIPVPKAKFIPPAGLSAAGDRLLVVREDGSAALLAMPSGTVVSEFPSVHKEAATGAVSPDGKWVVLASPRVKVATLFDAGTGQAVREFERGNPDLGWFNSARLAFTPDGRRVVGMFSRWTFAESHCHSKVECWEAATGTRTFDAAEGDGPSFTIRADGHEIAWPTSRGSVRLIDLNTGKQTRRIAVGPPNGVVYQAAYAPDGRHLVTANGNGTVYVIRLSEVTPPAPSADRTAAEWVLSVGGRVYVDGAGSELTTATELPHAPFRLTGIKLRDNQRVTDAELARFRDCKSLSSLELDSTGVTDAGLAHFRELRALTSLWLGGTRVTDDGLAHFKDFGPLTWLDLHNTQVTDAGLVRFKECKSLTHLDLRGTRVTDTGVAAFKGCQNLTGVHLDLTRVTNAGLAQLTALKLEELSLRGTGITDADLDLLAQIGTLAVLRLSDTKVTAAGVEKLKKALPKCQIEWEPSKP